MVNKTKSKNAACKSKAIKSAFQIAVEGTDDVKSGFCVGLQAVKASDRSKISVSLKSQLQGSMDIDSQVKAKYPDSNRWDYVLSFMNQLYFFEIHPAETSEVDKVIAKLKWLKEWLKESAPKIDALPKSDIPYTWVQSGRFSILPTAKDKLKLSQSGIVVSKRLNLQSPNSGYINKIQKGK